MSTDVRSPSFAEEALRLGGKGAEEVRRMGAVDTADDQVEELFAARHRTNASPIHRAVWDAAVTPDQWAAPVPVASPEAEQAMKNSLNVVRQHLVDGTFLDDEGKIAEGVLAELGVAGYWGLLVEKKYGGSGVPFTRFAKFITEMALLDPTVAGLASVHGCIGAVDPVQTFGTEEQKRRWLPELASGRRLSAFALTEPGAGSDLTALRTVAVRDGDEYVVTGEKLFITNVRPGRTIGLVCLIDGKPAVLVVDLPDTETPEFRLKNYGLYALKQCHNHGIVFDGFRVPAANLLEPTDGDGLTIAYHGLNRGRVALCANAAGAMRKMMADMVPWAKFRVTYGEPISKRELVRRRLGHLAGLVVACDALTEWCAALLDAGYRGEMECIIAKIFGSEAQKEAAIELHMKTHGGRAFLHGHLFGDNVHEFLAPCIYEGEGEMLGMAFFKSLVKQHGREFFEPIGRVLAANKIRTPNLMNPAHLWKLKGPMMRYAKWMAGQAFRRGHATLPDLPPNFRTHAEFAARNLRSMANEISATMRKHQLKLADRQCRMSELSSRVQSLVVILATAVYAGRQTDEYTRKAADGICRTLTRQFRGKRATDADLRDLTDLGAALADGHGDFTAGIDPQPVLMPYRA
ncbi:acyl- dehydrogenase : Acyl-coa dehydrogenase OS=Blastopirellula marina DSM 3645 GN=DSM3645_07086 PE=3 SV=1: Acyl-CoA_dh_N: Acyl-CoA_dh_M: Acyl-CoA_dh_1 [Gemmataceae bacterium]|nr:acyl- dehydrogenase : Acyl-coa dehydrogenase OS=Blastopirellula marina DSM 3645 GN=DSM3645_07086 PE=3 SV=1: Acyl-CoA_dh_N: Acyl-CoA_dh_M: Acyl-CoA_dh_1 [Gemmataceae bacterium]VTT97400.1 acyl- dehydrogenase : Acyl-coa dehydrogenase OS=Blastopirellula marina DSM 3645 GN=DSM3645_07086 PE=3 SV=1: Acyl-CoA_dh_N: Acyl-CoA_dh_M: Acyl-CoA_dh_1 [Gemmataceae bacterium]